MSDLSGNVRIEMEGPGRGKVFIDGVEVNGIVSVSVNLEAGGNNKVSIDLQPRILEFSGYCDVILGSVDIRKEIQEEPSGYRKKVLERMVKLVEGQIEKESRETTLTMHKSRETAVRQLWAERASKRAARALDASLPGPGSTQTKPRKRI